MLSFTGSAVQRTRGMTTSASSPPSTAVYRVIALDLPGCDKSDFFELYRNQS
jgi:hypothetical protein